MRSITEDEKEKADADTSIKDNKSVIKAELGNKFKDFLKNYILFNTI